MEKQTIGEAITELMNGAGATDEDVASALGVTAMTVYRWRTGRNPIKRGMLDALKSFCAKKTGIRPGLGK